MAVWRATTTKGKALDVTPVPLKSGAPLHRPTWQELATDFIGTRIALNASANSSFNVQIYSRSVW